MTLTRPHLLSSCNRYVRCVERDTGGAPCLFLHGASGDMTPLRSYEADTAIADQNGRQLGYAALSALTGMLPPEQELAFDRIEDSGARVMRARCPNLSDCYGHLETVPPSAC